MKRGSGRLIVFEGIDGTGKSTQLRLLRHYLEARDNRVVATREPTDGAYGQKIRSLYRSRSTLSPEEELALFINDRREHVTSVLAPALADGRIVLCDRYFLSTAAYQGAVGLDPELIIARNGFAPPPDLALVFELEPQEAVRRITEHRGELPNDFEQLGYLQKVDTVFRSMRLPYIRRIDASPAADQIQQRVRDLADGLLDHHQS
jgi:dTMP kinase